MVLWGAAWGVLLGLLWPGYFDELRAVLGAVLGALAGWTLRSALRKELRRLAAPGVAQPARVVRQPEERREAAAPQQLGPAVAAAAATATDPSILAAVQPSAAKELPTPTAPRQPDALATLLQRARDWLLGGNTVVRAGVVVLFIGLAFLAKYAVEHALLPPQLRLSAIGAAGIALFVLGLRLRSRRPERQAYATTLLGAGIAVLYLTVFAAFRLYQLLPAAAGFALLGAICLFCAIIALALDAQALAFIGFAGGFAAPVLVSTGQGNHVGLFSYYLLLGVAIAVIAWLRAWRPLNLLGFFATFGIATAWGVLKYEPGQFASTEPFLLAFFLVYLLASLFYALRHGSGARKAIDATLVFGTPLVAFGLQSALVKDTPFGAAFSALALAGLYVALGWWMLLRRRGDATVNRWLAECFGALALGFVTLAVPLALDGRWTSAVWAVEGAGVYWMAQRQQRWLARAFGLALQGIAALVFVGSHRAVPADAWPVANVAFLGAAMLAGAALAIAWWSRAARAQEGAGALERGFVAFEASLTPLLFWIGFLWLQVALGFECDRVARRMQAWPEPLFAPAQERLLRMAAWVLSAYALHSLALPARRAPWPVAATPSWLVMPIMLCVVLWAMGGQDHVFEGAGWIAWPAALVLHLLMLRRLDAGRPQRWWPWVHAGGVWLLVLLAGNLLMFAIGRAQLWRTAWATVILLVAATVVLLALTLACRDALRGSPRGWPLDRFTDAVAWRGAAPVALLLALGAMAVAISSSGETRPLPYVPLLNPTDLAVALALAACVLWLQAVRASQLPLPAAVRGPVPAAVLAAIAFIAINTVWLRVAHHFAGVPWNASSLFSSFLVQAGYSILWTLIALVLMVGAHRHALRTPWVLGGTLLALTVLKLFVIDLSNRGGSERIVVFIAVGLLMLVVGWFAPLPPSQVRKAAGPALQGAAP
jgi:uncharacterized membrane protein